MEPDTPDIVLQRSHSVETSFDNIANLKPPNGKDPRLFSIAHVLPLLFIVAVTCPTLLVWFSWYDISFTSLADVRNKAVVETMKNILGKTQLLLMEPSFSVNTIKFSLEMQNGYGNVTNIAQTYPFLISIIFHGTLDQNKDDTSMVVATVFNSSAFLLVDYSEQTKELYVGLKDETTNFSYVVRNCSHPDVFSSLYNLYLSNDNLWFSILPNCTISSINSYNAVEMDWYIEALGSVNNTDLIWSRINNVSNNTNILPSDLIFSMSRPFKGADGKPAGVVMSGITFSELEDFMRRSISYQNNYVQTTIFDENGKLIASSNKDDYNYLRGYNDTLAKSSFTNSLLEESIKYGGVQHIPFGSYSVDDWEYIVSSGDIQESKWILAVAMYSNEFIEDLEDQHDFSLYVLLTSIFCAFIISLIFSLGVIFPLEDLIEAFKKADKIFDDHVNSLQEYGDQKELNLSSFRVSDCYFFQLREISKLERNFRVMMKSLYESHMGTLKEMYSKEAFLRFVFHELRVPINAVVLGVEEMVESGASLTDEEKLESLNIVHDQVLAVVRILNDTLTIQKLAVGMFELQKQPFSITNLLDSVIWSFKDVAKKKNVALIRNLSSDAPEFVIGDDTRLRQVFANLISNAIKFTKTSVTINLIVKKLSIVNESNDDKMNKTESEEHENKHERESENGSENKSESESKNKSESESQSENKNNSLDPEYKEVVSLKIDVVDDGQGISDQNKIKLFQPFSQIRAGKDQAGGGSGLGLSIAKQLIEMHNGNIYVNSKLGEGSSFTCEISLPVFSASDMSNGNLPNIKKISECKISNGIVIQRSIEDESKEENLETKEKEDETEKEAKNWVLVVDDSSSNRRLVSSVIKRLGLPCEVASNGFEAVQKVNKKCPSLILMDKEMPEMNGDEAIKKIRENGFVIPIIAFTGSTLDDDVNLLMDAGATDVLFKPLKRQQLKDIFEKFKLI